MAAERSSYNFVRVLLFPAAVLPLSALIWCIPFACADGAMKSAAETAGASPSVQTSCPGDCKQHARSAPAVSPDASSMSDSTGASQLSRAENANEKTHSKTSSSSSSASELSLTALVKAAALPGNEEHSCDMEEDVLLDSAGLFSAEMHYLSVFWHSNGIFWRLAK